jgi:putative chitinase
MITLTQLKTIIPFAQKRAEIYLAPINAAIQEFSISTPARAAMWLANVAHESGSLRYALEIANGAAYNGRKDLGNTRPEAIEIAAQHGLTPGPMWRGRGLIQVTGYNNYRACSTDLYGDPMHLLHHPEILELPGAAARSAGWFWWRAGLSSFADDGDFDAVCDLINKGRKTQAVGDANGFEDRLAFYNRARQVLL